MIRLQGAGYSRGVVHRASITEKNEHPPTVETPYHVETQNFASLQTGNKIIY